MLRQIPGSSHVLAAVCGTLWWWRPGESAATLDDCDHQVCSAAAICGNAALCGTASGSIVQMVFDPGPAAAFELNTDLSTVTAGSESAVQLQLLLVGSTHREVRTWTGLSEPPVVQMLHEADHPTAVPLQLGTTSRPLVCGFTGQLELRRAGW